MEEEPIVIQAPKKHIAKKISVILLVILLIAGSSAGAYMWRDKTAKADAKKQATTIASLQSDKSDLEKQLADAQSKATTAKTATTNTPCTAKAPSASAIANIKASVTSGNTAALESYMAPSVSVVFAAADALGPKTPAQAVASVTTFIGNPTTVTWDFALSPTVLGNYAKGSYAQYIPAIAVVGKSSEKKVIAFSFDCNGKISTVFMSASEDLLL